MVAYVILAKILFISLLFTIYMVLFGLPSLETYLEKRMVFSEQKVDFDPNRPPAIMVSHIPLGESNNYKAVEDCFAKYNDSYDDSVICINKKLANISGIFLDMPQNIIGLKIKIYHTVNRLRSFLSFGSFRSIDCVIQVIWVIRVIQVIQ